MEDLIGETMEGKPPREPERPKNTASVALSKLGASKARAESLSARKRKMIAGKAASAHWKRS